MLKSDDSQPGIAPEWQRYAEAKRALFLGLVLTLTGVAIVVVCKQFEMPEVVSGGAMLLLNLPGAILLFGGGLVCQYWSCPGCSKLFFITCGWSNPFAECCQHCELPKWEVPGGAENEQRDEVFEAWGQSKSTSLSQ